MNASPSDPVARAYLAQLHGALYQRTRAPHFESLLLAGPEVPKYLKNKGHRPLALSELLRDHEDASIETNWEVGYRDGADDLLSYYSSLEIAVLTGLLDETAVRNWVGLEARYNLKRPELRRYYEEHYPLYLPQMFRDRLDGDPWLPAGSVGHSETLPTFLDLSALLSNSAEVDVFLWFLDDGYIGGVGLHDLLKLFGQPEALIRRLAQPRREEEDDEDPLDASVVGFSEFVEFCALFDDFLQSVAPPVASIYWSYHGYWFDKVGESVHRHLDEAFDALLSWQATKLADGDWDVEAERAAAEASIDRARRAVARLTSGRYARALKRLAEGRSKASSADDDVYGGASSQ